MPGGTLVLGTEMVSDEEATLLEVDSTTVVEIVLLDVVGIVDFPVGVDEVRLLEGVDVDSAEAVGEILPLDIVDVAMVE